MSDRYRHFGQRRSVPVDRDHQADEFRRRPRCCAWLFDSGVCQTPPAPGEKYCANHLKVKHRG